jgi:hypothetical protein
MQLHDYIGDLLYRYDCVVVPSFGAFLTQNQPSKSHDLSHAFYPPSKQLSFNNQLTNNDGLLANHIALLEGIPYENACQKITRSVLQWQTDLARGETVVLKHIGQLRQTEGALFFEPSYHINYLTDSFGLSAIVAKPIIREEEIAVVPLVTKKTSSSFVKYAAIFVVALGVSGFYLNHRLQQINDYNTLVEQNVQNDLNKEIQQATFVIDNPLPAVTIEVPQEDPKFHIIAGAFRVESNSLKALKSLINLGFDKAELLGQNSYGLHQVAYGSYHTAEEARDALADIRSTYNPSAWLLIDKE